MTGKKCLNILKLNVFVLGLQGLSHRVIYLWFSPPCIWIECIWCDLVVFKFRLDAVRTIQRSSESDLHLGQHFKQGQKGFQSTSTSRKGIRE